MIFDDLFFPLRCCSLVVLLYSTCACSGQPSSAFDPADSGVLEPPLADTSLRRAASPAGIASARAASIMRLLFLPRRTSRFSLQRHRGSVGARVLQAQFRPHRNRIFSGDTPRFVSKTNVIVSKTNDNVRKNNENITLI